jgi:hypothetical protein
MSRCRKRNSCFGVRRESLYLAVFSISWALLPNTVWSQNALPNCPINLCAIGVELGNAQGLARWADPQSGSACSAIYTHIQQAGQRLPLANRTCAQEPSPPWPIFQNWRGIQSDWESFLSQYGRGRPWCPGGRGDTSPIVFDRIIDGHDGMNDSQLYFQVGGWRGVLAQSVSYTALDRRPGVVQVRDDFTATCATLYLDVGALLGRAQVTLQQKPASASYAYSDALDQYNMAMQAINARQRAGAPRGVTDCGDFRPVVDLIDPVIRGGRQMGTALIASANNIRQTYLLQCEAAARQDESGTASTWMSRIKMGSPFNVVLDATSSNIGTLAAGRTYTVTYRNGAFTCTGFNLGTGGVGTWTYSNVNIDAFTISLWGAAFTFNERGEVFLLGSLAGHLRQ